MLHQHIGFVHGDAHIGNVLCKKNAPRKATLYIIRGTKYYVQDCGWHWCLSDFGRSRHIEPQSVSNNIKWADTPLLEILNFFDSVVTYFGSCSEIQSELKLVTQFLHLYGESRLHCLFSILFSDFEAHLDHEANIFVLN